MILEKKLELALKSNDRTVIECVFNEIYHEYYKLIYFVAGQYLSDDYEIENVSNDVFLNFFNNLNKIKLKNIKYYLTTSAKNLSLNVLKSKKDVERDYDFDKYITSENNKLIYRFLKDNLNEEEYNIVIEHVVYGKSLKELSKVFKCNSNTLKSKYLRAINKLKEKGGDYFG